MKESDTEKQNHTRRTKEIRWCKQSSDGDHQINEDRKDFRISTHEGHRSSTQQHVLTWITLVQRGACLKNFSQNWIQSTWWESWDVCNTWEEGEVSGTSKCDSKIKIKLRLDVLSSWNSIEESAQSCINRLHEGL